MFGRSRTRQLQLLCCWIPWLISYWIRSRSNKVKWYTFFSKKEQTSSLEIFPDILILFNRHFIFSSAQSLLSLIFTVCPWRRRPGTVDRYYWEAPSYLPSVARLSPVPPNTRCPLPVSHLPNAALLPPTPSLPGRLLHACSMLISAAVRCTTHYRDGTFVTVWGELHALPAERWGAFWQAGSSLRLFDQWQGCSGYKYFGIYHCFVN